MNFVIVKHANRFFETVISAEYVFLANSRRNSPYVTLALCQHRTPTL